MGMKLGLAVVLSPVLISSFHVPYLTIGRPLSASKFGKAAKLLSSSSGDVGGDEFTLGYSPNFRRHIVRKNGNVLCSFAWLDEAVQSYPKATRLAVPQSVFGDQLEIAGGGGTSMKEKTYPVSNVLNDRRETNEMEIRKYLGSTLGWYAGQVEAFLKDCPYILIWPVEILRERLEFLLAPLPEDNVVADVNATVIDWPIQFYVKGRGAGMSVAQVSHALSVMPALLFRDFQTETLHSHVDSERLRRAKFLYQETPAIVLDLTRKQLDALYGASSEDCVSYSYLHWKGWEHHQMRVVMQAFPGSVSCSVETSWELFGRGAAPTRKTLRSDALVYLQHRLQIGPSHLQAMFKTHPPLSYYPVNQLQRNCDALEDTLQFSSNDLRSLLLRMPSLLGTSVSALKHRSRFWTEDVGLSTGELCTVVCSQPSLLQYGIASNLEPKLLFLRELGLSRSTIKILTIKHSSIWGRSLEGHLRPLCDSMCARCGNMTAAEFGDVLQRAPLLALSNWKQNLLIKLEYLANRLTFSEEDLKTVITRQPQILLRGLSTFIQPRLDMLEERTSKEETRLVVLHNPSILLAPLDSLQARLDRMKSDASEGELRSLAKFPAKKSRRSRPVCLLTSDGESIEQRFANTEEAARYANVSKSYMWQILRHSRSLRGRKYIAIEAERTEDASATSRDMAVNATYGPKTTSSPSVESERSLTRDLSRLASLEPRPPFKLTIYAAARAFPPENTLRGRRRAGGMALQVPSWTTQDWKKVIPRVWRGSRYRLLGDGRTIILGYPYTRPSQPRCSLFACREALRAARVWMSEQSEALLSTPDSLEIEIVTDSNFCTKVLGNSTMLLEWGAIETRDQIKFEGPGPIYQLNPDILFPLAKTYTQMLQGNSSNALSAISFRKERYKRLDEGAQLAARLMYDSSK